VGVLVSVGEEFGMKVCQIVNLGFEAGGAEKSVKIINDGMCRRGHDVLVVATDHLAKDKRTFADVLVPSIKGNACTRFAGYFWYHEAYLRVKEAMAKFRPDVVHLHTIGEFSPSVLDATASYPRLLTVHGPEDWTLNLLRWNLRSASADTSRLSPGDIARYVYLRVVQRPAYLLRLRRIDRVLAPSRFVADAVHCDIGRVPTHVLPNGVTLPATTPVRDTSRVLFVGRLEPVKGARVLVEAIGRIAHRRPDALLTLVGDGTQRAELERLVTDLGLTSRVSFAGWLNADAVRSCYDAAALVVIPSVWPENFPTVALEALGVGRAIVGADVGGIPELVTTGENGLLVPPGNVEALAVALDDLLSDFNLLRAMGEQSARRGRGYGEETFLDRLETHYEEVVARHADRHR
jgi:glycosyltransferase involved in cell wall biosynthesis